ncbi:MAG: endo-1,4-beta-xylanase [Labilibaculum sp.]|nr:endo-1,4-beta-xylanase [Labilibaculum sp.]
MKLNRKKPILLFFVFCSLIISLNSCDDDKMEWGKDPSYGEVTIAELPLALAEKISRYDALNTYTDFILGAGIDRTLYMEDETFRNIVNENFDDITFGNSMKHRFITDANGGITTSNVDAFIVTAKEAGLSIYGHTLVWHSNQNSSYLNGLIAPEVIPSAGESQLDISALLDGSFDGWSRNNSGGITIVEGAGLNDGSAVRFEVTTAGNEWDTQLTSPELPVVEGHAYEVSFWIKSEDNGQARMSFSGMNDNYPKIDEEALFSTNAAWTQIKYNTNNSGDPLSTSADVIKIAFDMGKISGVYFVDINSLSVVDLDAEPTYLNLISNGDFESGSLDGWSAYNGNTPVYVTGSDAYEGGGAMQVINDADGNEWDTQIHSDFTANLTADQTYTISFMIRSEAVGSMRCSTTGNAQYQGDQATTTTWSLVEWEITGTGEEEGLNFDMGKIAGTYYIDNVIVTSGEAAPSSGPVIIEKTDEEKAELIGGAMESFITQMVTHFKGDVHAWDVVNEAMKEGGSIRDGNVTDAADDHFYWVKYLGKDYAVTAFKLARQFDADAKLFINDYNLEYSLAKCDGLIEYVQYIESQGATVDGIGTQMHISETSDKDKIAQMFEKLGATGKLIKISELDVRLGTNSPTAEQQANQADMYQYVLDMYMQYVPDAQRYGVTVWGLSDHEKEHEYWLPDESPNIWDANYERKHAYKGFADGLAGRDVSEDFTGELE